MKGRTFFQSLIPFSKKLMVGKPDIKNPCKENPDRKCTCKEDLIEPAPSYLEQTAEIADLQETRKALQGFKDDIQKRFDGADTRMVGGNHYLDMVMQPWKVEEKFATKDEFLAYLRLTALDYMLRQGKKNGSTLIEDIEKAEHTLQKFIEVYKN